MVISGQWLLADDDVMRPVIRGKILAADGFWVEVPLLVDTGADRTVLTAAILNRLAPETDQPRLLLQGIGGPVLSVLFRAQLMLPRRDGARAAITVQVAAFTDLTALDMSVLGRDILNLFAVIVDRPRDVVCLVAREHHYIIQPV